MPHNARQLEQADDAKAKALKLRKQGMEIPDIAKRLGVNKSTISRWLQTSK